MATRIIWWVLEAAGVFYYFLAFVIIIQGLWNRQILNLQCMQKVVFTQKCIWQTLFFCFALTLDHDILQNMPGQLVLRFSYIYYFAPRYHLLTLSASTYLTWNEPIIKIEVFSKNVTISSKKNFFWQLRFLVNKPIFTQSHHFLNAPDLHQINITGFAREKSYHVIISEKCIYLVIR